MAQSKKQAQRKKQKRTKARDLPDLVAEESGDETAAQGGTGSTAASSAAGAKNPKKSGNPAKSGKVRDEPAERAEGRTATAVDVDEIEEERLRKIAEEMAAGNTGTVKRTPTWYIALMLGFMVIGLLWLMVFYISGTTYPIPGIEYWNIGIGVGLMMVGLIMTTGWR